MDFAIFAWLMFLSAIALANFFLSIGINHNIKRNDMSSKFIDLEKEYPGIGERLQLFLKKYDDFTNENGDLKSLDEIGKIWGGISKQTVMRYLRGEITFEFLFYLHKCLNLNVNWLLSAKGNPFILP